MLFRLATQHSQTGVEGMECTIICWSENWSLYYRPGFILFVPRINLGRRAGGCVCVTVGEQPKQCG